MRRAAAFVLVLHPLHALLHPEDARALAGALAGRGLPASLTLAWAGLGLQLLCSLALLVRRWAVPAAWGHLGVLALGIVLVHGPRWYTVGGAVGPAGPGMEFSVMLGACLAALLWSRRAGRPEDRAREAVVFLRTAAALVLLAHPLHTLVDPEGLRAFGHEFDYPWFPYGVQLILGTMLLQVACSLALVSGRFVAAACLGHVFVLAMGVWLVHFPRWFVVGPGRHGMEYSALLMTCFLGLMWAHRPTLLR